MCRIKQGEIDDGCDPAYEVKRITTSQFSFHPLLESARLTTRRGNQPLVITWRGNGEIEKEPHADVKHDLPQGRMFVWIDAMLSRSAVASGEVKGERLNGSFLVHAYLSEGGVAVIDNY